MQRRSSRNWGDKVAKLTRRAIVAALALTMAVPAAAQSYSDGFTFLKAVRERDGNKATELVSQPGTTVVNVRDQSTGEGALHILAHGRDYSWISFLLGKGARPDIQNSQGETPLSIAAQLGWTEGADLLLRQGASVDLANSRGETPLILAVHNRDAAMVRLLLGHGANPKRADHVAGYSALDYARQDNRALPILHIIEGSSGGTARPAAAGPHP
jgi:ankyrin repeat protein